MQKVSLWSTSVPFPIYVNIGKLGGNLFPLPVHDILAASLYLAKINNIMLWSSEMEVLPLTPRPNNAETPDH